MFLSQSSVAAQSWQWAEYANSPQVDNASGVAVDKKVGDLYVVGTTQGALGEYSLPNAFGPDAWVAKYKPNGTLIWAFLLSGAGIGDLQDIAVDSATQRIYITGTISGNTQVQGLGGSVVTATPVAGQDMLIACYDSAGILLWYAVEGGPGNDFGMSLAVDGGDLYVTGNFQTTINLRGSPMALGSLVAGTGTQDWVLAKYNKATGVLSWGVGNILGSNISRSNAVAVDANRVYIAGSFTSATIGASGTSGNISLLNASAGDMDMFAFGFRKTDGLAQWGYRAGASGKNDEAAGIASDGLGLYISGRAAGNPDFPPLGAIPSGTLQDGYLSRHDPATGQANWVNMFGTVGAANLQMANDVSLDGSGNVLVAGFFSGSILFPNNSTTTSTIPSSGSTDLFLASIRNNGTLLWATKAGGAASSDGAADVAAFDVNMAYIAGNYANANSSYATSPVTTLPLDGFEDIVVAKYGNCFDYILTNTPVSANPIDICIGASSNITLTGSELGANYQLVDSATGLTVGGIVVGTGGNINLPTGNLNGSTTFYVQGYLSSLLCSRMLDGKVRVNTWAPIPVSLGPDTTVCPNQPVVLNAGLGFLNYLWNGGQLSSAITVSAAGSYQVTVTDIHNCLASDTVLVAHYPLSPVSIGPDIAQCPGPGPTLDAGPGFMSYAWSTFQFTQTTIITSPGTYSVTVTDGNGCPASDTMVFAFHALPVVALGPDAGACMGDSLVLDAGPGFAAYVWGGGQTTPTISAISPGTYQVTVTDANGCVGSDTINVLSFPLPTVSLGADVFQCLGSSLGLDAGAGFSAYAWSNGPTTQTFTAAAPGGYAVTVTDANGCMASDTLNFSWWPAQPVSLGPDTAVCSGGSISLDAGAGFTAYSWSSGQSTQAIVVAAPATVSVTVTDGNGCLLADTMVFGWNALPSPSLGADTAVCAGGSLSLNAGAFASYAWSTGETTATITLSAPGTAGVTVTDGNGCVAADTLVFGWNPLPVVTLGPDTAVCSGGSVVLDAGPGFAAYAWSDGAVTASIVVTAPGMVGVTVTDTNGCSASDTLDFSWNPVPVVGLNGLAAQYCIQDSAVQLLGSPVGGNFAGAATPTGTFDPGSAGAGNHQVAYTFTDSLGCTATDSQATQVAAMPSPALAGSDLSAAGTVELQASYPTVGTGHWIMQGIDGSISDSLDPQGTLLLNGFGSFTLVWTVENPPCPANFDTLSILVDSLHIPTGFSPNGDGVNDFYVIGGLEAYPVAEMKVYNRWGGLVWQSLHYKNDWNGENGRQEPLVDDTYFAELHIGSKKVTTYIVLKRQE